MICRTWRFCCLLGAFIYLLLQALKKLEEGKMEPAKPATGGIKFLHDTYIFEGTDALAIEVEINYDTDKISWQDGPMSHPQSISFNSVVEQQDHTLEIDSGNKHLRLILLTRELYQKYIHSGVPEQYLDSDEHLRDFYLKLINDPYGTMMG